MDVEKLAVSTVSGLINRCRDLSATIDDNDRTAFTDGHIDVYMQDSSRKKENIEHRVSVQVRGRKLAKKTKKVPSSYSMSLVEINGYQRLGGVLFLVVYFDRKTEEEHVTYAILNPFKIQEIVSNVGPSQNTVNVRLSQFPADRDELDALVRYSARTQTETVVLGFDSTLLEGAVNLTFYSGTKLDLAEPTRLSREEFDYSIFATTPGGMTFPVPVSIEVIPVDYVAQAVEYTVRAGEITFERPERRRLNPNTVELRLSTGLALILEEALEGMRLKINHSPSARFEERLRDLRFLLLAARDGFKLNGTNLPAASTPLNSMHELQMQLNILEKLDKLFDILGIDQGLISMEDISDKNLSQLIDLSVYVVDGHNLPREYHNISRLRQPIGSWTAELVVVPDAEPDRWRVVSLLDPTLEYIFAGEHVNDDGEPERYLITPHDAIRDDLVATTINLSLARLPEDYEKIAHNEGTFTIANMMVLRLIRASDTSEVRREYFLSAAFKLNEWLISHEGMENRHVINRWQILHREQKLSEQDKTNIRKLKHEVSKHAGEEAEAVSLYCAILLDDGDEADFLVSQMTPELVTNISRWPIWALRTRVQQSLPSSESVPLVE